MNKNESRYFNTAVKMDEALIALLERKEFAYITIKEICETAGVNRSTFYLHYENTADLLRETAQYITDRFFSSFSEDVRGLAQRLAGFDLQELIFITPEYLTPYLTFIRENQRIFRTAIRQSGSLGFEGIYNEMFRVIFDPILTRFRLPQQEKVYVMKFYLTGITAVVMEWLQNDCADSVDLIAKIVMNCIIRDPDIYEKTL